MCSLCGYCISILFIFLLHSSYLGILMHWFCMIFPRLILLMWSNIPAVPIYGDLVEWLGLPLNLANNRICSPNSLVEQELLTLPKHLRSPWYFSGFVLIQLYSVCVLMIVYCLVMFAMIFSIFVFCPSLRYFPLYLTP